MSIKGPSYSMNKNQTQVLLECEIGNNCTINQLHGMKNTEDPKFEYVLAKKIWYIGLCI